VLVKRAPSALQMHFSFSIIACKDGNTSITLPRALRQDYCKTTDTAHQSYIPEYSIKYTVLPL